MKYKIDVVRIRENTMTLNGWVLGRKLDAKAEFFVEDENHNPVPFRHVPVRRDDVSQAYLSRFMTGILALTSVFPMNGGRIIT